MNQVILKPKLTYFCGKHKYTTDDNYNFMLHIINDHDSEHCFWQPVGCKSWTVRKPIKQSDGTFKYGEPEIDYGRFRYLPLYDREADNEEKPCRMNHHFPLTEYPRGNVR